MHKFPISNFRRFADLPFEDLERLKYNIYVLDFDWNYLFVNGAVLKGLPNRNEDLIGKNMWQIFYELRIDPAFQKMKSDMEERKQVNFTTTSPITMKRITIFGYPLEDCYFFSASVLPDKQELLNELRTSLRRHS